MASSVFGGSKEKNAEAIYRKSGKFMNRSTGGK
jgi:hypothetical protein